MASDQWWQTPPVPFSPSTLHPSVFSDDDSELSIPPFSARPNNLFSRRAQNKLYKADVSYRVKITYGAWMSSFVSSTGEASLT